MALVPDQKFSTFDNGGDLEVGDIIVGLRGGLNTRFNYTGDLPVGVIIPITQGGTGANNASDARTNLGLGTIATQNASAVAITGGTIAGVAITSSTAALTSGTIAATPTAGTDITNKDYVDTALGGLVDSVTGMANEIDVDNTDPANPIVSLSSTIDTPGTFTIQTSTVIDEIIDDDTMASATDTNVSTSEAIVAYIASQISGGAPLAFQVFTASGTYNRTTGATKAFVITVGSGGGGGGVNATPIMGAGGGGAGEMRYVFITSGLGATETVTINSGGAGGTTSGTDGSAGGTVSFGAHVTANGGSGGVGATTNVGHQGGAGGTGGSGGTGFNGMIGLVGGRDGAGNPLGGNGASGVYGQGGPGAITTGAGGAALGFGSGGGGGAGSTAARAGGAGADGLILVWEYS